jgi:hypothetical protein
MLFCFCGQQRRKRKGVWVKDNTVAPFFFSFLRALCCTKGGAGIITSQPWEYKRRW